MSETSEKPRTPALTPDEVIAAQRSRQLTIISVVLLLLAGAVAAHRFTAPRELPSGTVDVARFNADDIMGIEISSAQGEKLKLSRDGTAWRVVNRFNALADAEEPGILLKKIAGAKRLARPVTEDAQRFYLYQLSDELAAHVILTDKTGKEVVHLLVGKGDNASSDYIRYAGKEGPAGIFELVDFGGSFDTIRARLKLDEENRPQPREWLQLDSFKTLPRDFEATRILIRDQDAEIELQSAPDPRNAGKRIWNMVRPQAEFGNFSAVTGALEAIKNLRGYDVAGRPSPQGTELGLADPKRYVEVRYNTLGEGSRQETLRLDFGTRKGSEVAVWVTGESRGEFIWWVNDGVLARVFRAAEEFTDVAPLPPPGPAVVQECRVQHILISWNGQGVTLKQPRTKKQARQLAEDVLAKARAEGSDWKALQKEHNEDSVDPHASFAIHPGANLVPEFITMGQSLKVGEFGLVESTYGYHIIKRTE
ncbi:hypothetical protein EDM80_11915 [bacterium]|nr:MAG: hypothetical protein EDM80_11915 [bacterium]RIK60098.1 MAG: hypothetical protein DCC64_14965 [Planctomycetota bacterium]